VFGAMVEDSVVVDLKLARTSRHVDNLPKSVADKIVSV